MDNTPFVVNTQAPHSLVKNALHDKIFQIKALVECLRIASTNSELTGHLIHDAMWAIDNNLEQVIQLQEFLGDD